MSQPRRTLGPTSHRTNQTLAQRRQTTHYNERMVSTTRARSVRRIATSKRIPYGASTRNVASLVPQGPVYQPIKLPNGTEVFKDDEQLFADAPSNPKPKVGALAKFREQPEKPADVNTDGFDPKVVRIFLSDGKFKPPPNGARVKSNVYRGVLPEEPEQKYQSLRADIENFRRDLERLKTESHSESDKEFAENLSSVLGYASQEIEQAHGNPKYEPFFSTPLRAENAWMDPPLNACFDRIQKTSKQNQDGLSDNDSRITYNLFREKDRAATGTFDKQYTNLETRMTRIEKFIGFIHNMDFPYPDLIRAYTFLLRRFDRIVSGQRFNVPSPQVRFVKEELRRIGHMMMQAEQRKPKQQEYQQRRQEWHKIDDLYTIMKDHDVLVFEFVHIISRLQCLKRVHERTYDTVERTMKLYRQQEALVEAVQADSDVLKTLLRTMEENSTQLRKNFNHLEHRLTVLEKTVDRL